MVRDDREASRFVLEEDGETAELRYGTEPGRIVLEHTEVPDALGGRGIGGRLVRAAVARARDEGLTIVPHCPFTQSWLRDHPGEVDGIEIDWS
jgi:predicted GNAT family acetyltransferase